MEAIKEKSAEKLARMFYKSIANQDGRARANFPDISLDKVNCDESHSVWVANFPNDNGYIIISTDNPTFPIVEFDTKGQFIYESLSEGRKLKFKRMIANYTQAATENSITTSIWDELAKEHNQDSDTTTVVDIEFFANRIIADSTDLPEQSNTATTRGGGTIPRRENQLGYPLINQLLYNRNRQWTIWMPYCIDMPNSYSGGVPTEGDIGPAWLPELTVFAISLNYYNRPDSLYNFFVAQPSVQTERKSTPLTKYFKNLTYELGATSYLINGAMIPWSYISDKIPSVLSKNHIYVNRFIRYYPDQAGFNTLKDHLSKRNIIIFLTPINGKIKHASLIDGVAELQTTITTNKYFLGIKVGSSSKNYYMDYLHNVSVVNHSNDDWVLYDALSTGENYAYLLKR